MRIAGTEVIWVRLAIRSGMVRKVTSWVAITEWVEVTILRFSVCGDYGTENDN